MILPFADAVATYYRRTPCPLWLPETPWHVGFRHLRGKRFDGRWVKSRHRVRTLHAVAQWAAQEGIIDLYYSVATWMNPHKLGPRGTSGTWRVAHNCPYSHDLVFDIDAKHPITDAGLEAARAIAGHLAALLHTDTQYVWQYAAFTGYKGFRLAYTDTGLDLSHTSVPHRLAVIEHRRKVFIEGLRVRWQQDGPHPAAPAPWPVCDEVITTDPMRIIRMPGSVHSRTGLICTRLSLDELAHAPIASMKHPLPTWDPPGLGSPPTNASAHPSLPTKHPRAGSRDAVAVHSGTMISTQASRSRRPHLSPPHPFGDVPSPASPEVLFITNNVVGTDGAYVPILKYQAGPRATNDVRHLQRKYRLGPAYLFKAEAGLVVLFLKIVQRRQLLRILRTSKATNRPPTGRYLMTWLPHGAPFVGMTPGPLTGHISLAHALHVAPHATVPIAPVSGAADLKVMKAVPKAAKKESP